MPTVTTEKGITLGYETLGDAQASCDIVMVTGLGIQLTRWPKPLRQKLADKGYRVTCFDNRDSGLSTHYPNIVLPRQGVLADAHGIAPEDYQAPYTLNDMAEDTVGLLDALGIGQAHLVGYSMGSTIAQLTACLYPEHIRTVTSVMTSSMNPALPPSAPGLAEVMERHTPDSVTERALYLDYRMTLNRALAGNRCPFDEEFHWGIVQDELERGYMRGSARRQFAAFASMGDFRSWLSSIHCPALVMHGTCDPLWPIACAQDVADTIPGAIFKPLNGMGHDVPSVFYGDVIDEIDHFVRRYKA
ncbi:alpha/beta fold hydrolase [Zymobacter sp. IVIA_5232.4 C2]|uniref:alpha/beta fold hydrolase n=1 Tax=Zymobacter sp. IVIA_5232.4 C2 TaxID=3394855 RepID=UPI0039C1388B